VSSVGIGDPQRRQDLDLELFHRLGLSVGLVIESQQMQEAVNDEMLEMVHGRDALLGGLRADCLDGQHDIAKLARLGRAAAGKDRTSVGASLPR
jgi:hypothetical protein